MSLQCSFVILFLASISAAARFQGRGSANYVGAPYPNDTKTVESSISVAVTALQSSSITAATFYSNTSGTAFPTNYVDHRPIGTGLKSTNTSNVPLSTSSRTSNASCTVHVADASIEWWYPPVYSHALATITSVWGNFSHTNSYTFLPHTTSFDAVNALETENACTSGWATYTEWDWTAWECLPYTEKPTAASTAVVYRTAVPPIPLNSKIPAYEIFSYDILLDELPSATTLISVAPNSTIIETSATPFVQFNAYEVEYRNSTETVLLSSTYIQEYWRNGIEHDTIATGYVPQEFLEHISHSACDSGKLQAVVTVLILVDMYYINQPTFAPGIVHWESTALGWEEDTPVVAFDQSMTSVQPHVASDWDLSDITTTPVVNSVKTLQGPHPVSTTKFVGGSKALQPRPSASQTVGTVGTALVVIGPSSVVVVGSQTLLPGGSAVTVDGTPVALAPSATAVVVGGTWLPLPQNLSPGRQKTVGILGSLPVVLVPSSIVIIGSQTLQPGGIAITLALRTTISLVPSATALVIGGTTSLLPQFVNPAVRTRAAPPVLTIGSFTWVPNAATQFFIGPGQTLIPGGTAIVDGIKVSLDTSAAFVVIGGSTQILPVSSLTSGETIEKQPELVLGGSTFTAILAGHSPSGPTFVISGQTLAPGGAPITVSDTVLSLAPSGSFLAIDDSTTTIATPAAVVAVQTDPPTLTVGNGVFKPLPGTGTSYQIGTALLTPGSDIVVAGTTISLALGATALIINGMTTSLATGAPPIVTNAPLLTIGSRTYTAAPGSGTTFVINGQTLTAGGTITVDGTTIVLSHQATELLYGSSGRSTSTALFPATTTRGTRATASASATEGQSVSDGSAAPTSTRKGRASRSKSQFRAFIVGIWSVAWLFV